MRSDLVRNHQDTTASNSCSSQHDHCALNPDPAGLQPGEGRGKGRVCGLEKRAESGLCPSPMCAPTSVACWLVAEIDSCIKAALALLLPPSSAPGSGSACRAAGQLEVSSLQHSRPALVQAAALGLCFCLHPESLSVGNEPQVLFISGSLLGFSHFCLFYPSSGTINPQPPGLGIH